MIDDMSEIYRTKLALVSPTGDPSLLDNSEREIAYWHTVWNTY